MQNFNAILSQLNIYCLLLFSSKTIMTTLLARVLLTLVVVAIAPAVPETCTLCPNGEKPRNGNAIVFPDGTGLVTCKEFAKDIIDYPDGSCNYPFPHAFQVVCEIGRAHV